MIGHRFPVAAMLIATSIVCLLAIAGSTAHTANAAAPLSDQQQLGKLLFFDADLSDPPGQACAVCHAPEVGFTGPDEAINKTGAVYEGAVPGRFGNRKPPASAYAGDSPILYYDAAEGAWVGGMFWDGRATGATLGDPLAEQAQGPFLNPLEQNIATPQAVVDKVLASSYSALFLQVCTDENTYYDCIGRSIAAYERSAEVNPFSSKYDAYLQGLATLTGQESKGLELFKGKAQCSACHTLDGEEAPFTDFTYDNLGLPRNPQNPFYSEPEWNPQGAAWVDLGLGGFLKSEGYAEAVWSAEIGKHKVPTLRNVDLRPGHKFVKAYGHNGYFKTLEGIVHFYNTRDVLPRCPDTTPDDPTDDYTEAQALKSKCWPAPEVAENVNTDELGNLGLNRGEELAIVAFLKTLSDGYIPAGVAAAGLTGPEGGALYLPILNTQ